MDVNAEISKFRNLALRNPAGVNVPISARVPGRKNILQDTVEGAAIGSGALFTALAFQKFFYPTGIRLTQRSGPHDGVRYWFQWPAGYIPMTRFLLKNGALPGLVLGGTYCATKHIITTLRDKEDYVALTGAGAVTGIVLAAPSKSPRLMVSASVMLGITGLVYGLYKMEYDWKESDEVKNEPSRGVYEPENLKKREA